MRKMRILFGLAIALTLTGCPGGSDDTLVDSTPPDTTDPTEPVIEIASLEVLTSNPQIPSDAALPVTITALLKDASNNFVPGLPVAFSADSGGVVVTQAETDPSGRATAELSAAGDPTNRVITVTATVTSGDTTLTNSVTVAVTGTQLTIAGPNSLVQGTTQTYTFVLADAAGNGVAGETIAVASSLGNTLASTSLTTDFSGQAQVDYTAVNGGTDTLTATSLGESAAATIEVSADTFSITAPAAGTEININATETVTARWIQNNAPVVGQTITFSTTRGSITPTNSVVTNANGEATVNVSADNAGTATITAVASNGPTTTQLVEFVAVTPDSIEVQADPFTVSPNSQSTITAIVRDVDGNLVKNKTINFSLDDITGGSLSVGTAVTDSQGRAQTFYTSTETTSSVDGVEVIATVDEDPNIEDSVFLTVAGREVFFSFGTGNEIAEPNPAQYSKLYVVQVTDADGRAVTDVTVSMSVNSVKYIKGFYWSDTIRDQWSRFGRVRCDDEDINRNGILDPGEDFNGNGTIEAGNIVTVEPGNFVTDSGGFGLVELLYPQEYGGFLEVELEARTSVQGTEFSEKSFFILENLADDVNDLEISPPARRIFVDDLDETNIPDMAPNDVQGAIGIPSPTGVYELLASPFGYNQDCSVWDFDN